MGKPYLIDNFENPHKAKNGNRWQFISDGVMGGRSRGDAGVTMTDGRRVLRLQGTVSLENNGGFLQVALDLGDATKLDANTLDAGAYRGIAITVKGDGRQYGLHLRTTAAQRPWQSYRAQFVAGAEWQKVALPFADFRAHRINKSFDPGRLRRLSVIAIAEPGEINLFIDEVAFYS